MLKGKNVVVGVCGGIAAYKVVDVVSRLKKQGADVHVVMTDNAAKFVSPLTFQSISHNPVVTDMFDEPKQWNIQHISMAEKADIIVIAPATANVIGKIANGIADDMLTTTVMASKAKLLFVPAMNFNMYANPIVQNNIKTLEKLGYLFMEPETGTMAEGSSGKGRLPEPVNIVNRLNNIFNDKNDMYGMKVLITAGPTREAIDPVRYISNHSSGKMGYAFAQEAANRGAQVKIISGPVDQPVPQNTEVTRVITADEMYAEVMKCYRDFDIIILVAAVADYKCKQVAENKIKKTGDEMLIELVKNPDIARELGRVKGSRIVVGTCAETRDLIENAKSKLVSKNFDMIMANDVTMEGAGFGTDTNIVKIIKKDSSVIELPLMSKLEVAGRVLDEVTGLIIKEDKHGN
ncbi:MAG: bifunctional phosphopantothenoylcysteine decarboxylase/phosphopantothenate--cysteine ligase CoaBC [Bacillota bacterium]|nr:bifunctional phosphopantothenoylcysteine decarboxylase/phosphopantothenate--cysteine ligase CoaBC [Bacillota bacterium]